MLDTNLYGKALSLLILQWQGRGSEPPGNITTLSIDVIKENTKSVLKGSHGNATVVSIALCVILYDFVIKFLYNSESWDFSGQRLGCGIPVSERMSALPHLQTVSGREEWYIRPNPDLPKTRELLFEEELELLRKTKKERIFGILSSFFGACITTVLIIILYNYFFQ